MKRVARVDLKLPIRCYASSTEPGAGVLGARGWACLPNGERVILSCVSEAPGVIDVAISLDDRLVGGLQIRVEARRAAVAVIAEQATEDELVERVDVLALAEAILAAFCEPADVAVLALARRDRRYTMPASIATRPPISPG